MRDIAALLFGSEPERREPREECLPGHPDTIDGPPLPSGDWCQTPPGRGTLEWLGFIRTRHAGRPAYSRRPQR
jgi:hypothetical protein